MTMCVADRGQVEADGSAIGRLPASRTVQSVAAFLVGATLAISSVGRPVE